MWQPGLEGVALAKFLARELWILYPNQIQAVQVPMLQFTESVKIETTPDRAWAYLVNVEKWWPPSNPEHESLEILDRDKALGKGTRIRIRERIAGIPCEAIGEVTEYVERERVTWQAEVARYRLWGITLEVTEGVRWSLGPLEKGVTLSACIWASFPGGPKGRCLEWMFKGPLRGEAKDRSHARRELEYIKQELENVHPKFERHDT